MEAEARVLSARGMRTWAELGVVMQAERPGLRVNALRPVYSGSTPWPELLRISTLLFLTALSEIEANSRGVIARPMPLAVPYIRQA